ncbi:hypothetical protein QBC37DRAFT_378541 [Rhypophila decipiens]|uniref:Uncharacterized protein n=1 Tax=Rhypophila decipiens TaxID=261697 RepID=A0AAN6Y082_9PEZI|nr:hypothetical protein QBC37DRAFT_378541 [Rhypophila decipiens]
MSLHNTFISKLRQAGLQPSLSRTAAMASEKLTNVNELVDNISNNNLLPQRSMRDAPGLFAHNHTSRVIFSASEQSSIGFIPHNVAFYETPQGILVGQNSGVPQAADEDSDEEEVPSIPLNTAFYEANQGIVIGQNAGASADNYDSDTTEEFPSTDYGSVATEAFPEEEEDELPSISSVPLDASFFETPQGFIIGREPRDCQLQRPCRSNGVPFDGRMIGVPTVRGPYVAVPKLGGGVELVPAWETASNVTEAFSDVDMEEAPIQRSTSKIEITNEADAFLGSIDYILPEAGKSADKGLTSPVKNKRKRTSEAGNNPSPPPTKRRRTSQEDEEINVPLGDVQILGVETPEPAYPAPEPARSRSSSHITARSMKTVRSATPEEFRPKSPETVLRNAGVATHDWAYPGPYPNGGKPPASPEPKAQETMRTKEVSPSDSQVRAADSFLARLSTELTSGPQEANMSAQTDSNDGSDPWPSPPSARMAKEDNESITAAQEKQAKYEGPSIAPQLATLDTAYLLRSS